MRDILWIVVEEKGCTLVTLPLSLPPNIGHFVHHRTVAAAAVAALNRKIIKATWPRALSFECFPAKSLQKMLFPFSAAKFHRGKRRKISLSLSLSGLFKYCFYGFRFLNDLTGCCCCCWIELANKVRVCVCVDRKKREKKEQQLSFWDLGWAAQRDDFDSAEKKWGKIQRTYWNGCWRVSKLSKRQCGNILIQQPSSHD